MNIIFKQALAELRPDEVRFILANQPQAEAVQSFITEEQVALQMNSNDDQDAENRRRRHIEREWPEIGTILTAEYYGARYTAEIVSATKRLKSGRQIRITSGPAATILCDSFSEAMLTATEAQRTQQNLARKGVSDGWVFWQWDGKPDDIDGEDDPPSEA